MPEENITSTFIDDGFREIVESIREARPSAVAQRVADALEILDTRLRLLEPCPSRRGNPHTWAPAGQRYAENPGDPLRCIYCGLTKGAP